MCFLLFFENAVSQKNDYASGELKYIHELMFHKEVNHKEIVDSRNRIVHLGLPLFEETDNEIFSMIYRFIERYALKMNLLPEIKAMEMMDLDKVQMDYKKLSKSTTADSFMVSFDSLGYMVSWNMMNVTFPKDFQLISGLNKKECEEFFVEKVNIYEKQYKQDSLMLKITDYVDSSNYVCKKGEKYYINELTNNQYYVRCGNDSLCPLYNSEYPQETVSNIIQSLFNTAFVLDVSQDMYGYKESTYKIPLTLFLNICKEEGCIPYIGVKNKDEDKIKTVVVFRNQYFGYNHMLVMNLTKEDLRCRSTARRRSRGGM